MPAPQYHPNLLHRDQAVLIVIDMQESLLRTLFEAERVERNVCALVQGAQALRIPVLASTQNRPRLGEVLPGVQRLLSPLSPAFDKMCFSCYADPAFASALDRFGRKQALLCGVEAHVCVSQTAHDLLAVGYQVHLAADAVSSRAESNWRLGLEKMRESGVLMSSVEIALFEMLHQAGTPEFREVLKLIK